jgi:hypothetical protein
MDVRISTKSTLDTVIEMPWQSGMTLGAGIEAISCQQRMSAITDSFPPPDIDHRNMSTSFTKIEKTEDVEKMINLSAASSFNLYGIDYSLDTTLIEKTAFSKTQISIIASQKIAFSEYLPGRYTMTKEAADASSDNPEDFRIRFGDYFVAGYSKSADFYAIYNCTATTYEELLDFKSDLSASQPDTFDVDVSAKITTAASKHNISIQCYVMMTGVKSNELTRLKEIDTKSVMEQLEMFTRTAVGERTKAILWHYSLIGAKIPPSINVSPEIMENLAKLYKNSYLGQVLLHSFPKHYKEKQERIFSAIENDIKFHRNELTVDEQLLDTLSEKMNNWFCDSKLILAYEDLYYQCKESKKKSNTKGTENGKQYKWNSGIIEYPDNENVVIELKFEHDFKKDYKLLTTQKHTFKYDENKYIIVGYQVLANWHDGTCGSWKRTAGDILSSSIQIQVESEGSRGTSWTVRVYAVKKENFNFD